MKARLLFSLLALLAPALCPSALEAATYTLNERIEVNILGSWDKATIIEIGVGEHEGEYKVHYDGYNSTYDRWLQPVYFRKVAGAVAAPPAAPTPPATVPQPAPAPAAAASAGESTGGPRLGKYHINSWGATGGVPLFLGRLELLAGGKYRFSRRSEGGLINEGDYRFDAATATVQWLSGPCKENAWGGAFTTERDGKTHKIRLRNSTIATNNAD